MLYKTRAVVLHHVKYGESSIILTLYTENHGRLTCMVNSVRTKKPRFPSTLFQPLTILEIDYYRRLNREIQRLKDAVIPYHYQTIPYNHSKSAIALFLAEVLYLALKEEESNRLLFEFIYNALQLLDASDDGIMAFHHWFMVHLTKYLGFFPTENILQGSYIHSSGMQSFQGITAALSGALMRIAGDPVHPPDLSDISHDDRNFLLERLIKYYSQHLDGFSGLRSFSVMQEVFQIKST